MRFVQKVAGQVHARLSLGSARANSNRPFLIVDIRWHVDFAANGWRDDGVASGTKALPCEQSTCPSLPQVGPAAVVRRVLGGSGYIDRTLAPGRVAKGRYR